MTDPRRPNLPEELEPELEDTLKALDSATRRITPDASFVSRLEHRLTDSYSASEVHPMPFTRKIAPALLVIVAIVALVVVVDWIFRSLAPQPSPASQGTPVLTQEARPTLTMQPPVTAPQASYPWRGLTLSLAVPLPASPEEVEIYSAEVYPHATVDDALALAQRFGIQGGVYETPGELPGTTDFVATDGRQSLRVRSTGFAEYISDIVKAYNAVAAQQSSSADQVIADFLQSHGYTFDYRIQWSELRGAYLVEPLAPDGMPLRYDFYAQPMMAVYLAPDDTVLRVMVSLVNTSNDPVAKVGIISAEVALSRLLEENRTSGILEAMHSPMAPLQEWKRSFPVDQPITLYGFVRSMRPVDAAQPSFVQLDGYPLSGEIRGLDQLSDPSYIAATGRLVQQDGALWFSVESWQLSQSQEDGLTGTLRRENDQVLLTTDDGAQLVLPDVPSDVPMPFENAFVVGTRKGDIFEWKSIDDRSFGGGGGGGGGGMGFYKLNLSGSPVAFPTATPAPITVPGEAQYIVQAGDTLGSIAAAHGTDADSLMRLNNMTDPGQLTVGQALVIPEVASQKVEALRGTLNITITKFPDGSQQVAYGFLPMNAGPYVLLEGQGLEQLQAYNSRPVDIWGTMQVSPRGEISTAHVDRFEIPFPDLKVQVLQGRQKGAEVAGQSMTLFTTDDGTTYVQYFGDGQTGPSLIGSEGDEVLLECVAVPGETFAGYPALRVMGGMLAIDPKSGLHVTLPVTMDKPIVLQAADMQQRPAAPESATIDSIELQHYVGDPRYAVRPPGSEPLFFQPVWRFAGHYSNGDTFEVLIQAASQEFLFPEIEPAMQPG
jgi:LysM repeat protein